MSLASITALPDSHMVPNTNLTSGPKDRTESYLRGNWEVIMPFCSGQDDNSKNLEVTMLPMNSRVTHLITHMYKREVLLILREMCMKERGKQAIPLVWGSEGNFMDLFLSSHHYEGSRESTLVVRRGGSISPEPSS